MPITTDALKALLLFLEERYPYEVSGHDNIKDPNINPNDLLALLQFCVDEGWITCRIINTEDGQIFYDIIRITSKGISYLRGWNLSDSH